MEELSEALLCPALPVHSNNETSPWPSSLESGKARGSVGYRAIRLCFSRTSLANNHDTQSDEDQRQRRTNW